MVGCRVASASDLRAVAHPIRLQILSLLTGAELSAADLARELGTTQANASYHVRVLASAGLIVSAGEERIRGGLAKRYRHPWQDSGVAGPEPPAHQSDVDEAYQRFIQAVSSEAVRRSAARRPGPGTISDAELWVDEDTWQRCVDLVIQASTLLHDAARPPRTDGTIRTNLSAVLFTMNDDGGGDAR